MFGAIVPPQISEHFLFFQRFVVIFISLMRSI